MEVSPSPTLKKMFGPWVLVGPGFFWPVFRPSLGWPRPYPLLHKLVDYSNCIGDIIPSYGQINQLPYKSLVMANINKSVALIFMHAMVRLNGSVTKFAP